MTDVSQGIRAAAEALASANIVASECAEAATLAKTQHDSIADRISTLLAEKASIATDRRAGRNNDAEQGARLAMIAMDIDDLSPILMEAAGAVSQANKELNESRRHVAVAEQTLANERENEILTRLLSRTDELANLLFNALTEIGKHQSRLGARNLWTPKKPLADHLHRLDLQRVYK